jgi:hypothetical protein
VVGCTVGQMVAEILTSEVSMSRIGKKPVLLPAGVQVKINGSDVHVKGPKG